MLEGIPVANELNHEIEVCLRLSEKGVRVVRIAIVSHTSNAETTPVLEGGSFFTSTFTSTCPGESDLTVGDAASNSCFGDVAILLHNLCASAKRETFTL